MDGLNRPDTLYLVDASVYVFRAWHAWPEEVRDADGEPVQAVHGFARFLLELLEKVGPSHIAVAFDESLETSFRNTLYPPYKANREPAPESLRRQFRLCREFADCLGLATVSDTAFEADDLIGTLLIAARLQGFRGMIVSADKDLSQLLQGEDRQWDFARNQIWGVDGVLPRYGVSAHQIADFLGLAGDAVDNIPGVPGIGAKTAAALLAHFGSLDILLSRLEEVAFLRMRGAAAHARRLREHRDLALLCRELATIRCDVEMAVVAPCARMPCNGEGLEGLIMQLRFGPLTRRRILAQI